MKNTNLAYSPRRSSGARWLWALRETEPIKFRHIIYWVAKKRKREAFERILLAWQQIATRTKKEPSIRSLIKEAHADFKTIKKALVDLRFSIERNELSRVGGGVFHTRRSRTTVTSSNVLVLEYSKNTTSNIWQPPKKEENVDFCSDEFQRRLMKELDDNQKRFAEMQEKYEREQKEKQSARIEVAETSRGPTISNRQGGKGDFDNKVRRISPSVIWGAFEHTATRGRSEASNRERERRIHVPDVREQPECSGWFED